MNLKVVITLLGVAVSALAMPHPPAYSEVNVVRYIDYGHHVDQKLIPGSHKPKEGSEEVENPKMQDVKDKQKEREEDQEVENKPMSEPDGAKRTVKGYTDKHDGFKAPNMRQQQQSTTSNIDEQNEEQEEPAPVEEAPFKKEQATVEDDKSEEKLE